MNAATASPGVDPFASASMVALLPCASIDVARDFWSALGCEVVWFQRRPNPYVGFRRGAMEVHYYGLEGHRPEDSHSTCAIVVADTAPVFESLADGLRTRYGRLPLTGFPRITRPRPRANNEGLSGFSLVDPDGNWLRFSRRPRPGRGEPRVSDDAPLATATAEVRAELPPLARALSDAVVQADSHGDAAQARKILGGAVRRAGSTADPADLVRSLAYLAELHVRVEDSRAALEALDRLDEVVATLDREVRVAMESPLAEAEELRSRL